MAIRPLIRFKTASHACLSPKQSPLSLGRSALVVMRWLSLLFPCLLLLPQPLQAQQQDAPDDTDGAFRVMYVQSASGVLAPDRHAIGWSPLAKLCLPRGRSACSFMCEA